nr:ribonuclease H-like domain-containing protein [Tanacetum cinerariifolium]
MGHEDGTLLVPYRLSNMVVARERERKARTTLLMALPEDHLAKFHKIADAKEMWEAIKSRFGSNDESKKMQKFQTLLSQLEIHGAGVSHEDVNQKFLTSLPSSWSRVTLIMRTKLGLDTLNFNDLYNNLRVFERDVKGTTASSSSNTQNINDDDLEEMNLKWQVAMISMRITYFYKRNGRKLQFDTRDTVGFDKTKVECFNCHKMGHFAFARDCRAKGNQDIRRRDYGYNGNKAKDNEALKEKEDLKTKVENWQNSSKNINRLLNTQMNANDKFELGYGDYRYGSILSYENEVLQSLFMNKEYDLENTPLNGRYANGMHTVPSPMTGNYMPSGPDLEIDYSKFTSGPKQTSANESNSKPVEDAFSDSDSSVEPSTFVPEPVDDPYKALKDKGIIDSGCFKHMTWNKAHLADYQKFKGGYVAFGGSNGRITGKGKIKAIKLNFEDVYYMEELEHYNLFSVSQMCDKKNKVLFTDTDCLVLSPNFKLPDEN